MFITANFRGVTPSEEAQVEVLKSEAKALRQPEADALKGKLDKIELTRLVKTGLSEKAAREQIKRAYRGELTGDCPIFVEDIGLVTAVDITRCPDRYHQSQCRDPEDSLDSCSPYKGMIYNNPLNIIIHSFGHSGQVLKVCRIPIHINVDDPNRMYKNMEQVLNTGVLPNVFNYNGSLVVIGNDGVLRPLMDVTANAVFKAQMTFFNLKEVNGEKTQVAGQIPMIVLKGFLNKGSWGLPKLTAIVHCPYFFNGKVIQAEGFNRESGLYLSKQFNLKV